ncbi:MAG TPA: GntR family transcriptional regulator, partial [bacterium]|nr:GntR family transcriptional regulator [bacterium]
LYQQIADDILLRVRSGELKVGHKIGSQRELAERHDVSLITVKKAISELINKGVLYSRTGKGTYVAEGPNGVKIAQHKTIGLVLSDLKSPYFSMIVGGVECTASEQGFAVMLSNSNGEMEREEHQIHRYMKLGVNGLIIASMNRDYRTPNPIRHLHRKHFPYVVVSYVQDPDIYHVGTDQAKGAYLATEHLIRLGHNRIGFLAGEPGNLLGDERKQGYMNALKANGKEYRDHDIFFSPFEGEWHDYKSGYSIGKEFAGLKDRPTAIFAYNDLTALGFQEALLEKGMRIPEDVALVGFDDIERSCYSPVTLTTVRQPTEKIGTLAMEKVMALINHEETEVRTILEPELVVRQSCGAG